MAIGTSSLTGASGEHYVMFRLLSMGYIAGIAPEGAPNADIIVTDAKTIKVDHPIIKQHSNGWLDKYKENWELLNLEK